MATAPRGGESVMIGRLMLRCVERGLLPDGLVRLGIRRLCAARLDEEAARIRGQNPVDAILPALAASPIATATDEANAQHYEVPPEFFLKALGPRLKYSSGYFADGTSDLARAEEDALAITVRRAGITDGADILELGCGWGSLTLWMAERLPTARITAITNSEHQRAFVMGRLAALGRLDVKVVRADMNAFDPGATFDRIVSVEMLEHMRNWPELFRRIARWLRPGARFFAHVFCHRRIPYLFEDRADEDWMARHFFSGGLMPSLDLMPSVARDLDHSETWTWDGTHYQRTANAWLSRIDADRDAVEAILARGGGPVPARQLFERWRMFFMACAELFGMRGGSEWLIAHHAFTRRR
jgi:cyclopropane-fatty-acyl-phospholipid synthase